MNFAVKPNFSRPINMNIAETKKPMQNIGFVIEWQAGITKYLQHSVPERLVPNE
jgi:hypothetical protein